MQLAIITYKLLALYLPSRDNLFESLTFSLEMSACTIFNSNINPAVSSSPCLFSPIPSSQYQENYIINLSVNFSPISSTLATG